MTSRPKMRAEEIDALIRSQTRADSTMLNRWAEAYGLGVHEGRALGFGFKRFHLYIEGYSDDLPDGPWEHPIQRDGGTLYLRTSLRIDQLEAVLTMLEFSRRRDALAS